LGQIRIDRVRTEDVEEARNQYLTGHSKTSANTWLRYLKLLFGWAVKRGLIDRVPWRVGLIRTQKKPRALLPVKKAMEWLAAVGRITGKRWGLAAAIQMMAAAGLRESEALTARWEWIDWDRKTYCPGKTKGREADPVSVPYWLLEFLEPCRLAHGVIARSPRGGAYSRGSTRRVVEQANKECGTPGLKPHGLRGTYATLLSEEGTPIQDIKKMMRHKDIKTTEGYLETDMERVRGAQERIAHRMGIGRKTGERRYVDTLLT
jgi:integrase